ncbi:Protein of unknown function [Gryllus bimaculatus]|nr:Protein of unknown function [Gryllus bimaculatus]
MDKKSNAYQKPSFFISKKKRKERKKEKMIGKEGIRKEIKVKMEINKTGKKGKKKVVYTDGRVVSRSSA